jgi:hypothetical protein
VPYKLRKMELSDNSTIYPRPEMVAARELGQFASVFGVILFCIIFSMEAISLYERRRYLFFDSNKRRALYSAFSLIGISFVGIVVLLDACFIMWLDWNGNDVGCDGLSKKTFCTYVLMKQMTYIFLCEYSR